MNVRSLRRRGVLGTLLAAAMVMALLPAAASAQDGIDEADAHSIVTLVIPDQTTMMAVVDGGFDLDHNMEPVGNGYTVTAVVTGAEAAALEDMGVGIDVELTPSELVAHEDAVRAQSEATLAEHASAAAAAGVEDIDTVVIARADYFTTLNDAKVISVEAKSDQGSAAELTMEWDAGPGTDIGDGGSISLQTFVDAGQYMYHRRQFTLGSNVDVTVDAPSSAAGTYSGPASSFGGSFSETPLAGQIVLVNDGTALPTEGCSPLIGFPAGAIALFDRGTCPFVQKVANAEAAGASSMIVANNVGGAPFAMTGGSSATIPSLMISQDDGVAIKAGLPATGSIAQPATVAPERVRVTSSLGGSVERDFEEWLDTDFPGPAHRYFSRFLDAYHDSHEYRQMILDLHTQFPTLTEIVDLPYLTNGYRRPGMALIGSTASGSANRVGVTSHAWGHEGGNDITLEFVDPGVPDSPLSVAVTGNAIVVSLATDAAGAPASTAAQVVAAIDASSAAAALVNAYTYRGNAGAGIVAAAGPVALTDDLQAPASVPREPFQVKALRIGKHRDGSRTGVLMYSQEHAREWQTPLVQIETANRLLHNYNTDHATKQLVDNLDIFIIPTVNPDGSLYSHYDFGSQRRNMTSYCVEGGNIDFNARDSWGVDNNRNYSAYSGFDGYSGASTSCTSDVFRGPAELSEPESANIDWIAGAYPNIKFSMNVHSSGNYFMWAPGSYITPGRIPAPRPSFGSENYFFVMADNILTFIKEHRGLAVTPARTGPISDVLYSAAGNSADMLWYDYGIFGFSFEVGTSFQPSWPEAGEQMMEFANGQIELLAEALTWTRDRYAPTSWINEDISSPSAGPVGITFASSEAVDIYYTTDGSNPTTGSAEYQRAGIREGGETLWFTETTTIKWFSVDMAGNVEGKYHPSRNNARTATITITP